MSVSFDKKLAELDAYLQMLIVENESLERKLTALSSTSSSSSSLQNIPAHDSEREGLLNIKTNLEALISSIKHAIVLLQIAKVSLKGTGSSNAFQPVAPVRHSQSPPTRPNRSAKHTASFSGGSSKDSYSNSSSIECNSSDSFSSQHNSVAGAISKRPSHVSSSRCPAESQPPLSASTGSQQAQVEAATPVVAPGSRRQPQQAQRQQQQLELEQQSKPRDSLAQQHQAALASSSEASVGKAKAAASAAAAASEHRLEGSERHVAVNLSETSVSPAGAAGFNGRAHQNGSRQVDDAGVADEDEEDAFFDAPDEQAAQGNANQPNSYEGEKGGTILARAPRTPIDDNNSHHQLQIDNLNSSATISEQSFRIPSSTMSPPPPPLAAGQPVAAMEEANNNDDNTIEDGSIDWDAMYEDEEEEELDSLEGQGSVVRHLLSQIRIGMDLTKVVLPTFILERRSLLEMYADFFAHPDLFSAIPDFATAEERMVQLVKWYLSAFHAGRRSSVAKKPYNPILGEIFRCNWDLTESNGTAGRGRQAAAPAPASSGQRQQLSFVAEQVSHHPPVSAFYAENKQKAISCCAHIYTKSKYLGLSVGVHNLGQGAIELHKHQETYVCTFPSAYGRSILTVPWVELGGSVTISCQQTGYKANIEFATKPFYGGSKHRITGEILRPNNEPLLAIEGEWNGVMYSRAPPKSSRKEVFVDTTNLPVIRKSVKSISAQESFESRNVWKEVTRALKIKDVNSATAAKTYIEQRQRDLLKERQEQGAKWKTRFFEQVGEGWRFSEQPPSS